MATIAQERAGIRDRLATIAGLRAHDVWPDVVTPPAAIVLPREGVYHQAMGDPGHHQNTYEIILLVAPVQRGTARGHQMIDPYISDTGSQSIRAAIEGDPTLGGIVETTVVTRWWDYGTIVIDAESIAGGTEYWGARLEVETHT